MAAARVIGNRILKSNCASVNYCRLFSSNRFDHRFNDRQISGIVNPNNNREGQHEFEKLANGMGKKVDKLHDEIDILRRQMNEVIAHQQSEIERRREEEYYGRIGLHIQGVGYAVIIGLALWRIYIVCSRD